MAQTSPSRSVNQGTEIALSPRHGRGLFAVRRFRRGELVGVFEGPKTARNGTHVLWLEDADGKPYGIRGTSDLRFLNHSSTPNAEFDDRNLLCIRTINSGQEITIHYGDDWAEVE